MWVKCVLVWFSQPLTSIFGLVNSSIKKRWLECHLHPSHSMPHQAPTEHTLKDPFFIFLSICSRTRFSHDWAYAHGPIFHKFEHTPKDLFFICLSIWRPIFHMILHILKPPFFVCLSLWTHFSKCFSFSRSKKRSCIQNKNYYVVRNGTWTCSRTTWKLTLICNDGWAILDILC